jgi:hypothetical protein
MFFLLYFIKMFNVNQHIWSILLFILQKVKIMTTNYCLYIFYPFSVSIIFILAKWKKKRYHTVKTQSEKKQIERGKLDSLSTHIYDHVPRTDISIKCGGVKLVVLFFPHLPSSWNEAVVQVFIIDFVSNITMTNVSDASFKVDNNWQNSYFSFIYLLTFEPIYQQSSYISEVFFWCYFYRI